MIRTVPALLVVSATLLGFSVHLQAGVINYTATGKLVLEQGLDSLGLAGKTFEFKASFDSSATYSTTGAGFPPSVKAISDSFLFDGSTYHEVNGIYFLPTESGQLLGGSNHASDPRWEISTGTTLLSLGSFSTRYNLPINVGEQISTSHFGGKLNPPSLFQINGTDTRYSIADFETRVGLGAVGPVPEPSSIAVFGLAAIGMLTAVRRRKR